MKRRMIMNYKETLFTFITKVFNLPSTTISERKLGLTQYLYKGKERVDNTVCEWEVKQKFVLFKLFEIVLLYTELDIDLAGIEEKSTRILNNGVYEYKNELIPINFKKKFFYDYKLIIKKLPKLKKCDADNVCEIERQILTKKIPITKDFEKDLILGIYPSGVLKINGDFNFYEPEIDPFSITN